LVGVVALVHQVDQVQVDQVQVDQVQVDQVQVDRVQVDRESQIIQQMSLHILHA
jgi:hypothetical protein